MGRLMSDGLGEGGWKQNQRTKHCRGKRQETNVRVRDSS